MPESPDDRCQSMARRIGPCGRLLVGGECPSADTHAAPVRALHGPRETPANLRPYRAASKSGGTEVAHAVVATDGRLRRAVYRQIGWHGQSGAFYALDEQPARFEPGSYSPLYICVENEPVCFDGD